MNSSKNKLKFLACLKRTITREIIFPIVRLNLINHFVGFILYQFACNSALRNTVFRWESCKGSVWESVKKCSRWCSEAGTRGLQATRKCTQVKHIEKLNRHASCSTTRQKFQIGHSVSPSAWTRNSVKSWGQVASPHCYRKTDSLHSFLTSV